MSLQTFTTCRHCGLQFPNPNTSMMVGDPNVKLALVSQFCITLTRHTLEKHRDKAQETELQVMQFGGLHRLFEFDVTSPELLQEMRGLAGPIVAQLTERLPGLMPASSYFKDDSPAIEILEILVEALKQISATISRYPLHDSNDAVSLEGVFEKYVNTALEVRNTAENALTLALDKMKTAPPAETTPTLVKV